MPIKIHANSNTFYHLVRASLKNVSLYTHIHCHQNTTMRWAGMMADGAMMGAKVGQMGTKVTDEGNLFCGMAQDLR